MRRPLLAAVCLLLLAPGACRRAGSGDSAGTGLAALGVPDPLLPGAAVAAGRDRARALADEDARATTAVVHADLDRRARQLLSDLEGSGAALAVREAVCTELEAMYWARFEADSSLAHRLDALARHASVCDRPAARSASATALRELVSATVASGNVDDAVSAIRALLVLEGAAEGPTEAEASQLRATMHDLMWPTFLERRRQRFVDKLADDWLAAGTWDLETDRVFAQLVVPPQPDCSAAGCEVPPEAARIAAHAALTELTIELGERSQGGADPGPCLQVGLELVNAGEAEIVFRAWAPLEGMIRALYECAR